MKLLEVAYVVPKSVIGRVSFVPQVVGELLYLLLHEVTAIQRLGLLRGCGDFICTERGTEGPLSILTKRGN